MRVIPENGIVRGNILTRSVLLSIWQNLVVVLVHRNDVIAWSLGSATATATAAAAATATAASSAEEQR